MGTLLDKPVTEKETSSTDHQGIKFAASSMQGWRVEMEDQHTINITIPGLEDHAFVSVFDGHGGAHAAEYAAKNILTTLCRTEDFKQYAKSRGDKEDVGLLEQSLVACFLQLDADLRVSEDVCQGDRSGCTALAAVVGPKYITVASAGDSRAVIGTAGETKPLSQDHKPDNPSEKRRIERAGGCVSMRRVDGDLAVSRALGDFQYKDRSDLGANDQKVSAEPDVRSHQRQRTDQVLLLACDGIWDVMTNEEAVDLVKTCAEEGEQNLGYICEELLDQCLFKGSRDNMSVVAVAFTGLQVAAEGGGVLTRRAIREQEEAKKQEEQAAMNNPVPEYNAGFQQVRNS